MLTRREFMAGVAKVLAGGVAAASGVLAIVPVEPEEVHPLSARPWIEAGNAMMDGMMDGIASQVGPSRDEYALVIQGPAIARAAIGLPDDFTTIYSEPCITRMYRREELMAHGVNWDPQPGDVCEIGVFLPSTFNWEY